MQIQVRFNISKCLEISSKILSRLAILSINFAGGSDAAKISCMSNGSKKHYHELVDKKTPANVSFPLR